jgi:hypothetical protein
VNAIATMNVLPTDVVELLSTSSVAEYVTLSAAGIPIDTPVLFFPSEQLRTFDLATGLSYPMKAERARRNPRVALLMEGGPDEPVVLIGGMAAVRDADLQANVDRYLSEAAYTLPHDPGWSLARQAVWYWTRIIVEVAPARILWWDSQAAMNGPPQRWDAPAGTTYPRSDPAPPGAVSQAASWDEPPWQRLAEQALSRGARAHLSWIDSEGFPVVVGARSIARGCDGFVLGLPKGLPWPAAGASCLTFNGAETFIGEASADGSDVIIRVERALPVFPMTSDMTQLWEPAPHTRAELMKRLRHETERRGVPIPTVPRERPAPTEGYKRRMARSRANAAPAKV